LLLPNVLFLLINFVYDTSYHLSSTAGCYGALIIQSQSFTALLMVCDLCIPFTIWLIIWKKKVSSKLKDYVGIIKIHSKRQLYVSIMENMLFLWYYVVMLMVDYAATISTMIPFTI